MSEERTEINSLGEFGLIDLLTKNIEIQQASTVLGVGDDAAVIDHFGRQTVVSTDMLVEGIHFDLMYTPLKHLGYKSVTVNLSDIYAMNATPTHITVSIAFNNRFSVEALNEFYEGVYAACEKYGVDLIGGDTSNSQKGFIISVTAIGEVAPDQFVRRSTAQKGDLLCVSGDLGAAFLGLTLLEREKKIYLESPQLQPDLEDQTYIIGRQLKPEARKNIVEWLEKNDIKPTAMMDVSDGLSSEILHICKQSNLGVVLYEEKIPIAQESKEMALKFGMDPTACALSGGEDYELLFTMKQEDYDKIVLSEEISVIGYMADISEGAHILTKGGNKFKLVAQGWNAFKQ
ncbi:MAG: thiamine-monophosphate kinase [Bacteroidetes bacterium]|uniref:thiamine-phosphate kinase n=1 Tax=unclassified Chitinophaga TaxID=2619133 RepID=UPI0009D5F895|nr:MULTISPECIES: thiamine-phosphate kinase [unclassified Chitinophaga]MBP1651534.1 thiamine-monophosphate kinase [Bacteroidota bacterium]OMP77780.1 thiamine-phosphate kinase [[Flexibacter] sp. ATCC 35208]WPV68931.1 thiamine-phosphate kinase [Chitinophaga sp. LS1]